MRDACFQIISRSLLKFGRQDLGELDLERDARLVVLTDHHINNATTISPLHGKRNLELDLRKGELFSKQALESLLEFSM